MIFNFLIFFSCCFAVLLANGIISRTLKFVVIVCNILFLLVLVVHSLKLSIHFSPSELNSLITKEGKEFIFGGIIFSLFNSFALLTAKHEYIKLNIPQYLIYSVSYLTIYYGDIRGLDYNIVLGVHPLTLLVSIFLPILTIWDTIKPSLNKREGNLNQIVFIRILLVNVILVGYNIYFELTQFKILGLTSV